jgi:hypothetical protein
MSIAALSSSVVFHRYRALAEAHDGLADRASDRYCTDAVAQCREWRRRVVRPWTV